MPAPMFGWADDHRSRKRTAKVFLLTQERELTCEAMIEGLTMKALIDTWASISLINEISIEA